MGTASPAAQKVILQLPRVLLERTDSLTGQLHVNRSSFIRQALEEKVERVESEQLEADLRDGYLQNADYYAVCLQEMHGDLLSEVFGRGE